MISRTILIPVILAAGIWFACFGRAAEPKPPTNLDWFDIATTNQEILILVGILTTNHVTNLVSVIRMMPVPEPCPECGGANHHERQICEMNQHDEVYQAIVSPLHHTNLILVAVGPTNSFIATNLIYHVYKTQPGWQGPPPLTFTNMIR